MKISECFDTSFLFKEATELLIVVDDKEIDNDCSGEEQILINACSTIVNVLYLLEKKEMI
jgi:hypothetical protein